MHTKEVYEGGSVKHGGTAVPGHFDVDLVLFSDSECSDTTWETIGVISRPDTGEVDRAIHLSRAI